MNRFGPDVLALSLVAVAGMASMSCVEVSSTGTAYENGRWFDGADFVETVFYEVDGRLARTPPGRVDSVVDLAGGFVIPPFAEVHNHNVEGTDFEEINRKYLEDGVFYVKNPNSLTRLVDPLRTAVADPKTVDVTFAGGGLTSRGGHPIGIAERNIERGTWIPVDGEGGFYWTVDDEEMFAEKWASIREAERDFLKVYLLYSADHAVRMRDPSTVGWRGLDPSLLSLVVDSAHAAGLRVSAHVETAADFAVAVAANVDEINHLPGFRPRETEPIELYRIDPLVAAGAAESDVTVVTTVSALLETLERASADPATARLVAPYRELIEHNLRVLVDAGVRVVVGSDRYEHTSVPEALALHRLGVFEPAVLLDMWTGASARAVFPDREIGRLADGYEANFLVLGGNPLVEFESVRDIRLRVKQGFDVNPVAVTPADDESTAPGGR